MFTLAPEVWNDGPTLQDFMGREGAPRVARKHLCQGGGGGGDTGQAPDYSAYISTMTGHGNTGINRSQNLFDWASKAGVDLADLARGLGGKATAAADQQQEFADRQMGDWESTYKPLYGAQAEDATRMYKDLPAYQEQQAGRAGADAAMAIDQGIQTQMRNMRAQGFNPGAVAMGQLGQNALIGRAMATTQEAQRGRDLAKQETRQTGQAAIQSGQFLPEASLKFGQQASGNNAQAMALNQGAINTTAGAHQAGLGYYNAAMPYFAEWGKSQRHEAELALKRQQMANEEGGGGEWGQLAGTVVGAGAGWLMGGPMGAGAGASIGGSIGGGTQKSLAGATGGRIPGRRYAAGGAIDTSPPMGGNLVPPEASPSGGSEVDDVPAMVSEGEFVIPKRTVDWLGDKFFQKLITKTDEEIEQQTVAAPEEGDGPPGGMPETPMFRSEGARV